MKWTEQLHKEASRWGTLPFSDFSFESTVVQTAVRDTTDVDVIVAEMVAYQKEPGLYGIWAKISEDPELVPHAFYVIYAEDAGETNGKGYEDLSDACRYIAAQEVENVGHA